jgi:uncharacterized RDD family membrane protein YckC
MSENTILDEKLSYEEYEVRDAYLAGAGKRFANYIIDVIVMYIFMVILSVLGFIYLPSDPEEPRLSIVFYMIFLFYYTLMEYFTGGKTIGKFITKTRAVRLDGKSLTFGEAFVRSISRFIPFEVFSCLGNPPKGWHDKIARTRVVEEKYLPG